jgi:hypothetical protein
MMDFDTWSSGILHALRELGDLEHQRLVWGKTTSPGNCFLEAYERLYDDYDLPGFEVAHLRLLQNHVAIHAELSALRLELEPIDPRQPEESIIESPRWPAVLEHAQGAYALLADSVTLAQRTPR